MRNWFCGVFACCSLIHSLALGLKGALSGLKDDSFLCGFPGRVVTLSV